ncbi:unnamed protein product [Rotaria magnacalcarata]|uniref:Uncharacterized protein n=2 Tax=Rotaria magnacalcarata TaxID=392030 RepID=A0A816TLB3_9BILA|nr:unnamed protein product [Rotaria magnacalcarata]CAF1615461.1 unnamed protein product [Rotaria magnacalcarata]CAF2102511.1 unnamed protein product [Rotaria magnacalcarata]CAF2212860.1 unnamed protein product [Rotaria magnacalcarata]CAF3935888.1 unnamed protein product [Rotaria magnacalcarata]
MIFIEWHFFLYLVLIFVLYKTAAVYSIQCCTSKDNTCSSKPVDCPSNICFKLVINKVTEERGCLDDLIELINSANKNNKTSSNRTTHPNGLSNDQCHKLGAYENGISLCKCTNNLCNLSSKRIHLTKSLIPFMILFVQYFLRNSLS